VGMGEWFIEDIYFSRHDFNFPMNANREMKAEVGYSTEHSGRY
jgi:hypothetical protein